MSYDFLNKNAVFSIEVFPPKDDVGFSAICANLDGFIALSPDFISVTYGAGGNEVGKSLDIVSAIEKYGKTTPVAHLTCVNGTFGKTDAVLNELKRRGIRNVLALRGDFRDGFSISDFKYATDLIEFIGKKGGFDISAACYPEGHPESDCFYKDIDIIKKKNDLGVKHFVSQLFFDNNDFYNMCEAADNKGVDAVFEAGIMPITNARQVLRIVKLSGAKLPSKLSKIISRYESNPAALRQAGINYAVEQITDLLTNGARGIHLYAMNNPQTAAEIHRAILPILEEINR